MQSGEYIVDRRLVRIVRYICEVNQISLKTFSDDWILELNKGDITRRICGYKFALNDSAAATIAQDKVASYEVLHAGGVPAAEHRLIRTKATKDNWPAIMWPEGIVLKPLMGTSGHGVRAFNDIAEAKRSLEGSPIEAWAISPRLNIAREIRLIMLDGKVLVAYSKHPVEKHGLKMFNLGKGATPELVKPTSAQVLFAVQSTEVLDLRLASVDVIELESGETMVLEVNDGIMMEYFSNTSEEYEHIAYEVYSSIINVMMTARL
ncbi:MAG: ATP-grasp domain-containing protein [Candidatus Saccharimonadales bacterium]